MIDYSLYCRIKQLDEQGHSAVQIGSMLDKDDPPQAWLDRGPRADASR